MGQVQYFMKDGLRDRGFCLGILLTRSLSPGPWYYIPALKALVRDLHPDSAAQGDSSQDVWESARWFFELGKARLADLAALACGIGEPSVEAASFPCQVAADMCFEDQTTPTIPGEGATPQLKGKHKEGINVLGIVTPHDIDMLERVADRARLDSVYDRCDVPREATALRPGHRTNLICTYRASRDRATGLAARDRGVVPRKPTYRLSTICFTWSVVTLWTELDRILQLDANTNSVARAHRASSLGGLVGRVRGRMCRLREALLRLLAQWQRQWKQRIARPVLAGSRLERSGRRRTELDGILQLDADTTASRARIAPFWAWADHGACMRTCALSAPGSAPASGAAAMAKEVVDRANSGRGSGPCANDPGAEHMCVRTETSSKGAGRRAARPHDDAVKYDSSDEDDVRTMVTRFLLSRPATVLPSTVSTLPDAQLALRNLLSPAPSPLSSFDARLVEWPAE
ncbi:hypothetical protein EDB85DRAFT_2148529 [Lactarius pseudohatsudake]|nr:hypothetical protein EDB85DRAFT_2148529 [Lactarius pseudohatsudake]